MAFPSCLPRRSSANTISMASHGLIIPHRPDHHWTVEEVLALPDDGNRYEVIAGELLVSPSPRRLHHLVLGRIYYALTAHAKAHGLEDVVAMAPADISWSDDTLVQPDVFIIAPEQRHNEWAGVTNLLLVIEVLSPSTALRDRNVKRRLYQQYVPEYWIVDPDEHAVEVWRRGDDAPHIERETLVWQSELAMPALTWDVRELTK